MVFTHIVNFLVDFFTHLNARKVFGGVLVLLGLWLVQNLAGAGGSNLALMYGAAGILVGGIGAVIIYLDMTKDKAGGGFSELDTIAKGYEQKERDKHQPSGWHMPESNAPDNTSTKRPS
jgi:hypothetical protein